MPQMSPFNWAFLLIVFMATIVTTMSKISFIKTSKSSNLYNFNMKFINYSWMW